jgi:uncharacterized membrane protein
MHYLLLKSLHVLSVTLFLGNIITGVFWKFHADRHGDLRGRALAVQGIIRSDRWFTMPGVFAIIITGVLMAISAHLPLLGTRWILWSLVLFGISGVCFGGFVGPLQKKLLANLQAGQTGTWNESEYRRLSRAWEIWGAVATLTPVAALFLMVFKPVL